MKQVARGKVYLVGAGPGDPRLITIKGLETIKKADVIINDRLASPKLLKYARDDAEIIYAGKASRDHFLTQEEIIDIIIKHATEGKTVVRLKGGDPFVFGRGGEEAEALARAGIEFEIVPGVTSAIAVPAYAGIPVTNRGYASSFCVVTGHEAAGKQDSDIKWDKLATAADTLIFLMGVENLPAIVEQLVSNGRDIDSPAAVIQWGTFPKQRTITGTLRNIVRNCHEANIGTPAITIVGDVVRLRDVISWFEKKPLFGKRILVTRAEAQASALSGPLEDLGADVYELPVIDFVPPPDYKLIDSAIEQIDSFDWLIFTSVNGVDWFIRRLFELGRDIRAMAGLKLAAIGPSTAKYLKDIKINVDFVPSVYMAENVVSEFPEDINGKKILIPRALKARDELPEGLKRKCAEVLVAPVYETVAAQTSKEELAKIIEEGLDIVTFTSASTVDNFFSLLGETKMPNGVILACIGPVTADALREHGIEPQIVSKEFTMDGLVRAILEYLTSH